MFYRRFGVTWATAALALGLFGPAAAEPREKIDLNGTWAFRLDPGNTGGAERWYAGGPKFPLKIQVPGAWQAQGIGAPSGVLRHHYAGIAWYRRSVTVPETWRGRIVRLRIGGVHRRARAYVNGVEIGDHDGFSAPFCFDVTRAIRPGGPNAIVLRVENPPVTIDASPDKQTAVLPTGMLNYIGNWGGFYGGVTLESTSRAWISSTYITSDVANRRIAVRVQVQSEGAQPGNATVRVSARGSVAEAHLPISASGTAETNVELAVPDAQLWSPEHPDLTTAFVELLGNGKVVDRTEQRFGFRTITTNGNKLLLNGKPIYLRGYGDDNVEVLTGFPPADRNVFLQRLSVARSYGFNAVRFHSMVPPEAFFDAADEAGILVMAELPAAYTQYFFAHRGYLKAELKNVLLAYRNHPSLLSLGLGNEFNLRWLQNDEDRRVFVTAIADFYALAKGLAPATLIMSNDGFDLRPTDMVSMGRGAAPDRPTIRHEFGAYYCSLPDIGLIDRFTGVMEPEWLKAKRSWVERHELAGVYGAYLRNSQRLQQLGHKYQIERVRADARVSGYDYWLIVDYPGGTGEGDSWEEGWLDYFWHPKTATPEEGRELNSPVLLTISAGVDDRAIWSDQPKQIAVSVSNFGPAPIRNGALAWSVLADGAPIHHGELSDVSAPLGAVSELGKITLDTREIRAPARVDLVLTLKAGNGSYRNEWSFWSYPPVSAATPPAVRVASDLRWAGLRRVYSWIAADASHLGAKDLLITGSLDANAMAHLRGGGRVWLLLSDSPQRRAISFFPASGGALGTLVLDHPALAGFPHQDFCDLQFYNLLQGAQPLAIDDWPPAISPIIGGIRTTSEFLSKTKDLSRVAFAAEVNAAGGSLLITTLRLRERFDEAFPEAMSAFDAFLRYASGPDFRPSAALPDANLRRLTAE